MPGRFFLTLLSRLFRTSRSEEEGPETSPYLFTPCQQPMHKKDFLSVDPVSEMIQELPAFSVSRGRKMSTRRRFFRRTRKPPAAPSPAFDHPPPPPILLRPEPIPPGTQEPQTPAPPNRSRDDADTSPNMGSGRLPEADRGPDSPHPPAGPGFTGRPGHSGFWEGLGSAPAGKRH